MSAIVGVDGLEATYEAVRSVNGSAWPIKKSWWPAENWSWRRRQASGAELIPVDSEHNGAHQCLRAGLRSEVSKLILTASGGPFRRTLPRTCDYVTPGQALNHPTWKMGQRITIDSATLMNKGFEVIEACWLFDFPPKDVEVVVHPQSKVHAMVEYVDGSVIAQVSATDMRMPIQYALTYPERADAPVPRLDWASPRAGRSIRRISRNFRCCKLAYEAQEAGGSATATLNAADEIAVEAFLAEPDSVPGIAATVAETLEKCRAKSPQSVGEVLEIDREARRVAAGVIQARWGERVKWSQPNQRFARRLNIEE